MSEQHFGFTWIDHVQMAIPEGGEALGRSFWVGALGFTELPKPAPMRSSGGAWFRAGAVEIHLGVDPAFVPAAKAHPALIVEQLDRFAEHCMAQGLQPQWDDRYPGVADSI